MQSKGLGNYGEALAVKYLTNLGYNILDRNFTSKMGEIDIIAEDGEYLVFVEVKYRTDTAYGLPFEAVTKAKQRKIKKTAQYYLLRHNAFDKDCRFDIIDVQGDVIEHYKNAF